jgi:hypothetical protein
MKKLPTRKSKEEEKKEEKQKTVYDNKQFKSGITSYIGNSLFGGAPSTEWA